MDKKLIMVYGLTEQQQVILKEKFFEENVADVTDCFSDLISVPAAAVVVNPSEMGKREQQAFNEVFEHDFDTSIILIEEMQEMRFLYTKEESPHTMEDTIAAIDERLMIPVEYNEAEFHVAKTVFGVKSIIKPDEDSSYRGQIGHMESSCIPYNYLTKIMREIPNLKLRERYSYRIELNSILMSAMLAHGLINENDLEFKEEHIGFDRTWILEMADKIGIHYEETVSKNTPKKTV